jgi:hypothetical protein
MAGEKLMKNPADLWPGDPEGVAEEVEAGVLLVPSAFRVLAGHDLRLLGVHLESQGPEPFSECYPQMQGLGLGVAVDNRRRAGGRGGPAVAF